MLAFKKIEDQKLSIFVKMTSIFIGTTGFVSLTKCIEIETERFFLRTLTENDATERYLSWLHDADAKQFITAASNTVGLVSLKKYVIEKTSQKDVYFFGIFDKTTSQHIGNIKYEPVNFKLKYAIVGVLIGESICRGKGVTTEVLKESAIWLREWHNIKQILLGVSKENHAAIQAYKKTGFVIAKTPYIKSTSGTISMVWGL